MIENFIQKGYLKRYTVFILGIFCIAFGISLIIKATLGTSPISNLPYVLHVLFKQSIGLYTLYFNISFILFQVVLLGKKTSPSIFLQLPVAAIFSYFIDLSLHMLEFLNPEIYMEKSLYLLLGCFILAFGVYLEIIADIIMLPGDAFVKVFSDRFNMDFGYVKVGFDATLAISSIILGYIYTYTIIGVREGTIVAALSVGLIVKFLKHKLTFVQEYVQHEAIVDRIKSLNTTHTVVTISREYGSRGNDVGKRLAKELSVPFYDSDIIKLISKDDRFSEKFVKENEQSIPQKSPLDSLLSMDIKNETPEDKLFQAETKVIMELASKGSCVIMGRCADYILRDFTNCINVFVYANESFKIQTVSKRENLNETDAKHLIDDIDTKRSHHYNYYTKKIWGLARNYDIAISTSFAGLDETVQIIGKYVKNQMPSNA